MKNEKVENSLSDLRIATMAPDTYWGSVIKFFGPLFDQLFGMRKLRHLYESSKLSGMDKQEFSKNVLQALGVQVLGGKDILTKLPKTGRCIVVCNHPYGMIEGIIIANLLTDFRTDTKIMANVGLQIFKEIKDYFIFANPLKPQAPINTSALKQCFQHLNHDGLLVLFPAGRVSFYQAEKKIISDASWNRLTIQLSDKTNTPILPLFISGTNSALFHRLGRVYYRFRLMMLAREMFKLHKHEIKLSAMKLLTTTQTNQYQDTKSKNDFIRMQCYLNDRDYFCPWQADKTLGAFKEIIAPANKGTMKAELSQLPEEQHLLDFKSFSVYYGYQDQIPTCVQEITRLREVTFRTLKEGSGEVRDTDAFDATYMHLFIFDYKKEGIIGAYRIGQTDLLQKQGDLSQLYLSQMFKFKPTFINQQQPCLEMGRSFIIAEHQNSFYGLLLLWKGIGAFVCQNPRYRTLYGTVSLSKLYDPRSVALINEVMVTERIGVEARSAFNSRLHPEVKYFTSNNALTIEQLSSIIMTIEEDGKDIPVLLKQYAKLGANFHCTAIDTNFNHTPGLLLSVDLPKAPEKLLKLYLGKGRDKYLNFREVVEH
jgi:putative hemolysin